MRAVLSGLTRRFSGYGRGLGWPTANIVSDTKLADGIYFGYADIGVYRQHPAMIFIGTPTTVGDTDRRVEAHLLDIDDQDLYALSLRLDIRHFHRANQSFASVEELKAAIAADEKAARTWFKQS